MSISVSSDIVFDVLSNAEPARAKQARDRLTGLEGLENDGFKLDTISSIGSRQRPDFPKLISSVSDQPINGAGDVAEFRNLSTKGLNEVLWSRYFDELMPNTKTSWFGGGPANSIWKGFLARELARQIGTRGSFEKSPVSGDAAISRGA
jgi:hypothetical protein